MTTTGISSIRSFFQSLDKERRQTSLVKSQFPLEFQRELLEELDNEIWLASNGFLAPEIQLAMARYAEPDARKELARNHSITIETQQLLARDREHTVRIAAACSFSLDPLVQAFVSFDEEENVRDALAWNPRLTPSPEMSYAFLRDDVPSKEVRESALEPLRALDPEVLAVLEPSWCGSLAQLVTAAESFAPGS